MRGENAMSKSKGKKNYSYKEYTFTYEGKRYHTYGKTEREAKRKADKKLEELKAKSRAVTDYTVAEWTDAWINTYKTNTSASWKKAVKRMIDKDINPSIGNMMLADVRPMDIAEVTNALSKYSESYANKILLVIKQIFKAAEENELIVKDPARSAKLPKCRANTERRTITPLERETAIKTAREHPEDGRLFMIMLFCGCRPQEVSALQMKDFDMENHVLHITKARKSDGEIGEPKSKAGVRDVPIPDALIEFLPEKESEEYVCVNTVGDPLTRESSQRMWKRFKKAMDIETDMTPYCFRHTYCTDLQDAGVPIVVASRLMGHSDIALTSKIYTHHSKESFDDALTKLNKLHECK